MNLDALNKDYFRLLAIGASGSGKTFYICNQIIPAITNKYDVFYIISPGYNSNVYKQAIAKNKLVICVDSTKFGKTGLKDTLNNIFFAIDKTEKKNIKDQHGHKVYKHNTIILLDDCLSEEYSKSTEMMNLFMRSRHYQCSIIMTSNATTRIITPQMLNNSSYLFVFKLMGKSRNDMLNMMMNYVDVKGSDKEIKKYCDDLLDQKVDSVKYGNMIIDLQDSKIY